MNANLKGHIAMFGANAIWGLMSPVSKLIMTGGVISPLVMNDLRVGGAMLLFWFTSFFQATVKLEVQHLHRSPPFLERSGKGGGGRWKSGIGSSGNTR